jgi:HEAT repeat protein
VKALGRVEPYVPQTTCIFLEALADRSLGIRDDAAVGLGRVTDLNSEIVDALLAAIKSTPPVTKAAATLGHLAGSIASFGGLRQLKEVARTLRKALHRCDDWQRYDDVYEALERIVEEITNIEARSATTDLPLSESAMTQRIQPSWTVIGLSILVSAILGLASNVVASYLQGRYHLISDPTRLTAVVVTFLVSLIVSIGLSWWIGKSE